MQKSMSKSGIDTRSGFMTAFEQQVVRERVDVGDAERIRDERAGARAAARTDRNVLATSPSAMNSVTIRK